ncbi:hypothetical protein NW752_003322 [Fusarium irregulare]|uniref:Uncharacterized protein n=1 Tax=Fusarium irregulare TaxID=2494466 RepID=A0A9W8PS86_9HYPO|nr:hypothetical protein NW766_004389 [Fusarium irregulare]KAJ4022867.1 hypothetical protein NW752_003322 [Fusarium irregulare]
MNKCWFVLEQPFFTPPVYALPSKAGGKCEGDLRLGDIVPTPRNLYPVLTKGPLPLFTPDMRISTTEICDFSWDITREREGDTTLGGGAPAAVAAGATMNAEVKGAFKRTMKDWVKYEAMDMEIVQPSKMFINAVLEKEDVKDYIDRHRTPILDQWTVYIVTGLMIGRASGTVGNSALSSNTIGGGPELDIPGIVNARANASITSSNEVSKSASVQGDRIWAVRLAKIHKGFLRSRWEQTGETIGAALDGCKNEEENVSEVLLQEGVTDVNILQAASERGQLTFVTAPGSTRD